MGISKKELSELMECKICGAKVMRLYDEGICLMCKAKRASNSPALRKISNMSIKRNLKNIISAKRAIGKKKIKERK
ncbi:MAG: hypothetical protein KJ886_00155 [Candidatus Thermoplasmatota archaeon]|nr:hypothetical protein [Candidatus Thermoplasmatota archaeon]MCG2826011.1 hypothetical protein [Thermoplasmatales archaeon]